MVKIFCCFLLNLASHTQHSMKMQLFIALCFIFVLHLQQHQCRTSYCSCYYLLWQNFCVL